MRSTKELAQEELRMRSEAQQQAQGRQYSAFRDVYPLDEKRPVSALSGLLDAIHDQLEVKPTASALTGFLGGTN
ncbi:MAG: hypothetical protein O3A71_05200 [Proteobacteria bacterium]|nr:hypothetical protein [Pseudomonadota bacterium]